MMRALILWLALVTPILPVPMQAQTAPIPVRTAEHGAFTRIVVQFPERRDWRFGRVAEGYALDPGAAGVDFAVAGAFDRIDRNRLAGLRKTGGWLVLELACACYATAVVFRDTWVVIDVIDGPAPPDSGFEAALTVPDAGPSQPPPTGALSDSERPVWARRGMNDMLLFDDGTPVTRTTFQDRGWPRTELAGAAEPRRPAETQGTAEEAALLRDVARAVSQGLLAADIDPSPELAVDAAPVPAPAIPATPSEATTANRHVRVEAETSIDRDSGGRPARHEVSPAGRACLPDADVAVHEWGGPEPAAEGLSTRRQALLQEFDLADPAALLTLAQYQIYLGFGAEAAATLALLPSSPDPVLLALARLVDLDPAGSAFDAQHDCPGPVAFWSVLAAGQAAVTARADRQAVLSTFSALPLHLRRHLAPTLTDLLLAAGDPAGAGAVRNAVARAPGAHGPALDLVDARLAIGGGGAKDAAERLQAMLPDAGPATPEVMIELLRAGLAAGTATEAQSNTADALAFELGDTATGRDLVRLSVEAALADGAPVRAASILAGSTLPDAQAAVLWTSIGRAVVTMPEDVAFLHAHFALHDQLRGHDMPQDVIEGLAGRLQRLGFAGPALDVLADASDPTAFGATVAISGTDPPNPPPPDVWPREAPVMPSSDRAIPPEAAPSASGTPAAEALTDAIPDRIAPADRPGPAFTEASRIDQARAALRRAAETRAQLSRLLNPQPPVGG